MRIYITYCSRQKEDSFKNINFEVTPDILYISPRRIKPFMNRCKEKNVNWAIFSDSYGVWFSDEKHKWYEKSPDDVSELEFRTLLENFDCRLQNFDEIVFYRPSRTWFHHLYKRLLEETKLKNKIRLISSIRKIK